MASSVGDRLRAARKAAKLTLEAVGKHVGVTLQAVQQWEMGLNEPPISAVVSMAELMRADLVWILTGKGTDPRRRRSDFIAAAKSVPRLDPQLFRQSSSKARVDALLGEDMCPVLSDCSPETFWFLIEDDRNAPEFLRGDKIIFDPRVAPVPGDMVLVYLPRLNELIFGEYGLDLSDGTAIQIVSLNPGWGRCVIRPNDRAEIVGTMIQHIRNRRAHSG